MKLKLKSSASAFRGSASPFGFPLGLLALLRRTFVGGRGEVGGIDAALGLVFLQHLLKFLQLLLQRVDVVLQRRVAAFPELNLLDGGRNQCLKVFQESSLDVSLN